MATVRNKLVGPDGTPISGAQIVVRLYSQAAWDGANTREVVGYWEAITDSAGLWSVNLQPNSLLTPLGTTYEAVEYVPSPLTQLPQAQAALAFVVPNTAGPFWVYDILTASPATPASFLSSVVPAGVVNNDGTPSAGVAILAARADHIHELAFEAVTTTPSALQRITAQAAGVVPLALRGAVSQTANLTEWQNSAGALLLAVGSSGYLTATAGQEVGVQTANQGTIGLIVKGSASQSADLQRWNTSAGGVSASMGATGEFAARTLAIGGAYVTGQAFVTAAAAGTNPLVVQGAAGQTADLQQWRDSAATVHAAITSAGNLQFGQAGSGTTYRISHGNTGIHISLLSTNVTALNQPQVVLGGNGAFSGVQVSVPVGANTTIGQTIQGAASQSADLLRFQDSTPAVLTAFNNLGYMVMNGGSGAAAAMTSIKTPGSATVGISVRSNVNGLQTGNLFEARAPGSQVTTYIDSGGQLWADANGASVVPLSVRGVAGGNTSNLSEWWTSPSGSKIAYVDPIGQIVARAFFSDPSVVDQTTTFGLLSQASNRVVGVVRGAVGQTSDLFQFKDSVPTVIARVTAAGGIGSGADPAVLGLSKGIAVRDDGAGPTIWFERQSDTAAIDIFLKRAKAGGVAVTSGLGLGTIQGWGHDGTNHRLAGTISFVADATPANSSTPGRIEVATTPAGSSQIPVTRLQIKSDGTWVIKQPSVPDMTLGNDGSNNPRWFLGSGTFVFQSNQTSGITTQITKAGGANTDTNVLLQLNDVFGGTNASRKFLQLQGQSSELFSIDSLGVPKWTATAIQQLTVGAAGGASALPATPSKYLQVRDSAGTLLVIPAYAAS